MAYQPWTPPPEQAARWEELGLLRDRLEAEAWGRVIDDPAELARRERRVEAVVDQMAEIAPKGYFDRDR